MIESLLASRPAWIQLGVVLAHFLWQGAVLALLLAAVLWLLRHRSPNVRYVLCGAAMLLMAICPALTLSYLRYHTLPTLSISQRTVPQQNSAQLPNLPNTDDIEIVDGYQSRASEEAVIPHIDHPLADGRGSDVFPDLRTHLESTLARGLEWSALVWSIGVLMLSLRLLLGWWRLRRLARRDTEPLSEAVEAVVRRLSERLRITHRVRVLAAKAWNGPAAFGLFKPVVLMPVAVLTQCPLELIEAMIAHELAHIRRYDLWVNLLQRVIETLLFYHPAIWWVSGRMRMERELCCDDLAVQATGRRADYATALVEICRLQPSWVTPAMAAGIFGPKLSLLTRVRRVLQSSHAPGESNRGRFWLSGPLSILLAGAFVFVACLRGADKHSVAATQPAANTQRHITKPTTRPAADSAEADEVELLGVTQRRPHKLVKWWAPNGSPLPQEVYAEPTIYSNEDNAYEFAVSVPEDSTCLASRPQDKMAVETYVPKSRDQKYLPELRAFVIPYFRPDETESTIQLRVATGAWEEVEGWEYNDWARDGAINSQSGVVMTWPRQEHGSVRVQLTHIYAFYATRLIATDTQGNLHTPRENPGGKGTGVVGRVYIYDGLMLKNLKRLEFQRRPYNTWFTFENVSLRSGHKTEPKVKIETPPVSDKSGQPEPIFSQHTPASQNKLYTFNWVNQSLPSVLAILEAKTGLTIRGLGNIGSDLETATFSYRPPNPVSLEDAMAGLNDLLKVQGYWIMHRDKSLEIRKLTDWLLELKREASLSERSTATQAQQMPALEQATRTAASRPAGDAPVTPPPLLINFENTPLRKAVEEFGRMSGLRVIGINNIHPDIAQLPITLVFPQPIAFDEALSSFDQAILDVERAKGLVDSGIWIVRREYGLVIRQLTEWYHHIPARNWFASEAEYRQAKLPGWELARVQYKPRALGTAYLVSLAMDAVPYNTSRALVDSKVSSPNNTPFDLAGFVYFINAQLEVLARRDVSEYSQMPSPVVDLDVMTRGNATPLKRKPASQPIDQVPSGFSSQMKTRSPWLNTEQPPNHVPVRTLTDGIITEIKVKEGQAVKKGDLLVQLDDQEIRLETDAAEVRLNQRRAECERLAKLKEAEKTEYPALYEKSLPEMKLAQIEFQRCRLRLERTQIKSPADGMIHVASENLINLVGKRVTAGDLLLFIETKAPEKEAAAGE